MNKSTDYFNKCKYICCSKKCEEENECSCLTEKCICKYCNEIQCYKKQAFYLKQSLYKKN